VYHLEPYLMILFFGAVVSLKRDKPYLYAARQAPLVSCHIPMGATYFVSFLFLFTDDWSAG